jgi:hypothetical protein
MSSFPDLSEDARRVPAATRRWRSAARLPSLGDSTPIPKTPKPPPGCMSDNLGVSFASVRVADGFERMDKATSTDARWDERALPQFAFDQFLRSSSARWMTRSLTSFETGPAGLVVRDVTCERDLQQLRAADAREHPRHAYKHQLPVQVFGEGKQRSFFRFDVPRRNKS